MLASVSWHPTLIRTALTILASLKAKVDKSTLTTIFYIHSWLLFLIFENEQIIIPWHPYNESYLILMLSSRQFKLVNSQC